VDGRAAAGGADIDDGQYTQIETLRTALARIFAHVTKKQAVAAGWLTPPGAVLHDALAYSTVQGLWGEGEIALWGRLSVIRGEPLLNPDKPHRRLGKLMRIPTRPTFLVRRGEGEAWERIEGDELDLIREDDGTWSVGDNDGGTRWIDICVTYRSYKNAVAEAKDRLHIIGEHRKAISDGALLQYAKDHPKHGRPRIYKALRDAGYGVTKQRVADALAIRDAGDRLKGGAERQG
jgi:hypothetical protein